MHARQDESLELGSLVLLSLLAARSSDLSLFSTVFCTLIIPLCAPLLPSSCLPYRSVVELTRERGVFNQQEPFINLDSLAACYSLSPRLASAASVLDAEGRLRELKIRSFGNLGSQPTARSLATDVPSHLITVFKLHVHVHAVGREVPGCRGVPRGCSKIQTGKDMAAVDKSGRVTDREAGKQKLLAFVLILL